VRFFVVVSQIASCKSPLINVFNKYKGEVSAYAVVIEEIGLARLFCEGAPL